MRPRRLRLRRRQLSVVKPWKRLMNKECLPSYRLPKKGIPRLGLRKKLPNEGLPNKRLPN